MTLTRTEQLEREMVHGVALGIYALVGPNHWNTCEKRATEIVRYIVDRYGRHLEETLRDDRQPTD